MRARLFTPGVMSPMVASLLLVACGGASDDFGLNDLAGGGAGDNESDGSEEFADAFNQATGAGGGGTLIFDGQEISIANATCIFDGDTYDSGTVSDNGFRVFATKSRPDSESSAQILDDSSVQWFQKNTQGDEIQRDGIVLSSAAATYFNNVDDRLVEASFTIECP